MLASSLLLSLWCASAMTSTPAADPQKRSQSTFLRDYAETRRFLAGRPVSARVTPDGEAVLFLRSESRGAVQSLFEFSVATKETRKVLDVATLLGGAQTELSDAEKARLERQRISARGLTHYALSPDGKSVLSSLSGKLYRFERASGKVTALAVGPGPIDPQFSPDSKKLAYVRQGDLYAYDFASKKETRLTKKGSDTLTHGLAEFVAQEEMGRSRGFWWSPDSASIAYEEADTSALERFHIVDPVRPEAEPLVFPYPRAGKMNATVRLGIVALGTGKTKWLAWDRDAFPYLASVVWAKEKDGGRLTVVVQNRAQTDERILVAQGRAQTLTEVHRETDDAWVELDQNFPKWVEGGKSFLWYTERNGGPEVELRSATGAPLGSVVGPAANFHGFVAWDDAARELTFIGGEDPARLNVFRAKVGQAPVRVEGLPAPGWQEAAASDAGGLLLVNDTNFETMPTWRLYRREGDRAQLVSNLPDVAEKPPFALRVERKKVGSGNGFHTLVFRPSNFQKGKKYPVLLSVYGGPRTQVVKEVMREHLLSQHYAEQGFIVVKVDGRGTPRRGRTWERSIKHDFAGPTLDDQVAAVQALCAELPELDASRIAIEGWSFGGYMSALAVLRRPDVFKTAVAGAPVTEWLDYDTHYTERYLGVPTSEKDDAYVRSSLLPLAPKLSRPLLLVHGTADDNVYFFHSLKLSDALFRAGKTHDVLPLSGQTHMVADPAVTERLYGHVASYLLEHLK